MDVCQEGLVGVDKSLYSVMYRAEIEQGLLEEESRVLKNSGS